jgi:hypothetical protein
MRFAHLKIGRNTQIINFFDLCAISLPLPRGDALPVGLMVVARNGQDRWLLRMAARGRTAVCLSDKRRAELERRADRGSSGLPAWLSVSGGASLCPLGASGEWADVAAGIARLSDLMAPRSRAGAVDG